MEERLKLGMLNEIASLECESSCTVLGRKRGRNMMMKLREGTAAFQIEVGRWKGMVPYIHMHPKVSLLAEMGDLPVRWRAKLQCMLFWVRVLSSRAYDGRLIRRVATEAVKFGRSNWMWKLNMCCKEFGWQEVNMEEVRGLSNAE